MNVTIAKLTALATDNTPRIEWEVRENPHAELFTVWKDEDGEGLKQVSIGPFVTIRGALKYVTDQLAYTLEG